MTLAELVPIALKISILAIVFSLGLAARPAELIYLFRRPRELARSLLVMCVLMPLLAYALVQVFSLPRPVAIVLIALSLAPVPPLLPRKQAKAHGDEAYSIGLLVAVALISVVWIPLALEINQRVFGLPLGVPIGAVAKVVAMTVLAPLIAGVVVAKFAPGLAPRLGRLFSTLGWLLLLTAAVLVLASQWRVIASLVHDGTLVAMALFVVIGMAAGHLIGGPDPSDRTVLATAACSRHPGVALAISHLNFPDEHLIAAAVLLFLLVNMVLTIPYVFWRKRVGAAAAIA
ncbi:hypothetical protein [Phenylobacterium sp.]|uniref:bile acid:sodium symporter family protein n=1 Tax=Phenylobacterium sp. TaxID=1871053 RepID=UPI0025F68BBD|nr:hypothetical protein [Phenylobacterium sp.]